MRKIVLFLALLGMLLSMVPGANAGLREAGRLEPTIQYLLPDTDQPLSPTGADQRGDWQSLGDESPNFGYVSDPAWFRFPVPAGEDWKNQVVDVSYPQLDSVKFYLFHNGQVIKQLVTGDWLPMSSRILHHPHFLFPYTLKPGGDYHILVRVQTQGAIQLPVTVWQRNAFFDHISVVNQSHAIYYGILITVICFNLFVFVAMRERTYLYYALSTFGYLLLLSTLRGNSFALVWPENPWLHNHAMMISVPFAMLFSSLFVRSFLRLAARNPLLDKLVITLIVANLLLILGTFVLGYNLSMRLSLAVAMPGYLLLTVVGPLEWMKGNRTAGLYTLAWGALTVGSALTAMNKYGWIPSNFVTEFGMEIGSALEAILLTIALAIRLYQERENSIRSRESQVQALAARRQAELRMMEQALHHPLTGLPNRSSFEIHLQDRLTENPHDSFAIGIIQLTNLQAITKTLGHRNTDRVLELTAARFNDIFLQMPGIEAIEQTTTKSFVLASLESATFGFLVRSSEARMDRKRIAECLKEIRESIEYLGMQLPLEPMIGVSFCPEQSSDPNTLIRQACVAQENEHARNMGIAYYQPKHDFYSAERLTLAAQLRKVLGNGELALYFQPKLSLRSRQVIGVEALIRWPGQLGTTADEIITVAEQTGLIKPLTRWVLQQAMQAREALLAAGHDLSIAVNISPNNLREPDFPDFVKRLMAANPQHHGRLVLEVTETSMMLDPTNSLKALRSLEKTGIPLSIDDFGSGYSSLSYIKQLPAGEIKIDRSLITDLLAQADDRVIVQTTIDMCHSLGYTVVAEGVEDQETVELLARMNCDMIQGYFLARPTPLSQLTEWLAERTQTEEKQRRA